MDDDSQSTADPLIVEYDLYSPVRQEWDHHRVDYGRPGCKPVPKALRWEVWERDNFTCRHCQSRRDLSIDHIVAESRGGATTLVNLQTLCRPCNSRKGCR